jgi:hypothetical protein
MCVLDLDLDLALVLVLVLVLDFVSLSVFTSDFLPFYFRTFLFLNISIFGTFLFLNHL